MKFKSLASVLVMFALLAAIPGPALAQGTAFTYQGHLNDGPVPANGNYDLQFGLYGDAVFPLLLGLPITNSAVGVTNGLFNVTLDFGPGVFSGSPRWLGIGVRTNGSVADFAILVPRQPLTPAPYAIYAGNAATALSASSVSANAIAAGGIQDATITASKLAAGQVVKTLNGLTDNVVLSAGANMTLTTNGNGLQLSSSGGATSGWALAGNANTASTNFLGTSDNLALELRVNGARAFRLEPNATGPNVIGGYRSNSVSSGAYAATIAGGGSSTGLNHVGGNYGTVGGGFSNQALSTYDVVAGGYGNSSSGGYSTISGGAINHATGFFSAVPGGEANTASGSGSFVGGGYANSATNSYDVVAGGSFNFALGGDSTVGGGAGNNATGVYSTVPGGYNNLASGYGSFAAGIDSFSTHDHTFVWGDGSQTASSTGSNRFEVLAKGGVNLYADVGNVNIAYPADLNFGFRTRQMLNLYDISYGIGVQNYTLYQRTAASGGFAWYAGGVHSDGVTNAGSGGTTLMTLDNNGDLSFGQKTREMLSLWNDGTALGDYAIGVQAATVYFRSGDAFCWFQGGTHTDNALSPGTGGTTLMKLESFNPGAHGSSFGLLTVGALRINGGSDLAEPFQMSTVDLPKGSVVVIDEENAGRLKLSDRAYDTRVAGIISGANGINPGISLTQEGALEDGQNVALSGRAYVLADASNGAIKPGDLLTTSSTPGRAMKVAGHDLAEGAIIGKAMSSLKQGEGMVLVLVSLQ